MRFLSIAKDGGPKSTVTGYWLIELKKLFSVALLKFENGSRDEFHDHAFDSINWVLKGELHEEFLDGKGRAHTPSLRPVVTLRRHFHRVVSVGTTWVLAFRGPWADHWHEWDPKRRERITLTHGRKIIHGPRL